jgi:hypothetical protein
MTEFHEGDIVKFIDELGGGKVLKVIDKNTVLLLDDNGFDYKVEASRLMLVKPAKGRKNGNQNKPHNHTQQTTGHHKKPATVKVTTNVPYSIDNIKESSVQKYGDTKILLAFVPDNSNILVSDINIYLVNDSKYKLYFQLAVKKEAVFTGIEDGILEPETQMLILTLTRKQLLSVKEIALRGLIVLPSFIKEGKPFEEIVKIKPVRFTKEGSYKKNEYFEVPSIIHTFTPVRKFVEFPEDYDKKYVKHNSGANLLPGRFNNEKVEIDLHIENLEKNYRQLAPDQIMSIQINHFIKVLEKALISDPVKYLVVIHGIGNGRLKTSIRKILREDYPSLRFGDAPFEEYGYGATLIKIK